MTATDALPSDLEYREGTGAYHFRHDWDGETELSTAVLLALQAVVGGDALDREPLYRSLDLEALDRLFEPISAEVPRERGELMLAYAGSSITVRASGHVVIAPDAPARDAGDLRADD